MEWKCGVREREKLQKVQKRYGRWILGLEWESPEYMIKEELK